MICLPHESRRGLRPEFWGHRRVVSARVPLGSEAIGLLDDVGPAPGPRLLRGPSLERNLLLAGLPDRASGTLWPRLQRVWLPARQVLLEPDRPIRSVYFPLTGVLAETVRMADGATVEVNLVGREGVAGLAALLGGERAPIEVATLVPGVFLRLPVDAATDALAHDEPLLDRLHLYTQAVLNVRAYSVGCDRLHSIHARLARWLLKTHDRVDGDEFDLTHDLLALMLGVARPSVTVNAIAMQRDGLIEYRRGHVRVVNRPGLERAACECYWGVRAEFERLLGWPAG